LGVWGVGGTPSSQETEWIKPYWSVVGWQSRRQNSDIIREGSQRSRAQSENGEAQ